MKGGKEEERKPGACGHSSMFVSQCNRLN
jgi:hypothetical protein